MWIVKVVCSDPDCAEEQELIVAELDEADVAMCDCGCCVETLSVAGFEPLAQNSVKNLFVAGFF